MGALSRLGIYRFGAIGRVAGLLVGIRGRAYVIGALQRGYFYRFGAKFYSPLPGYFEGIFGLRTEVNGLNLMFKTGMKDEILPVRFGHNWIRGSVHISRTGLLSFVITAMDSERFPKVERKNPEIFSDGQAEDGSYFQSNSKERY